MRHRNNNSKSICNFIFLPSFNKLYSKIPPKFTAVKFGTTEQTLYFYHPFDYNKPMKHLYSLIISIILSVPLYARHTVKRSTMRDNWFISLYVGSSAPITQRTYFEHTIPHAAIRLGRGLTPSYALGVQIQTLFNETPGSAPASLFVKTTYLSLDHIVNLNNWLCGYNGRPDIFEIIAIAGLGWGHDFHSHPFDYHTTNYLTSHIEVQFCVNLGKQRAWQVHLSPTLTYRMSEPSSGFQPYFNVNRSHIGLKTGVTYRFRNSHGTHSFKPAHLYDQVEIDVLNARINDLQEELRRLQQK